MQATSAFLSYSHRDREVVRRVAEALRARTIDVWFDEWNVRAGDLLVSAMERGLQQAQSVVLFLSSHSAQSRWVREEYEAALSCETAGTPQTPRRIIPARLDDTPMPPFLASRAWADFRGGFSAGVIALLAGLLGPEKLPPFERELRSTIDAASLTGIHEAPISRPVQPHLEIYLREWRENQEQLIKLAAADVGGIADSMSFRFDKLEDRLGNLLRDTRGYHFMSDVLELLVCGPSNLTVPALIDHLFDRQTALLQRYGQDTDHYKAELDAQRVRHTLDEVLASLALDHR